MTEQRLGIFQVATLLISASCGIGFLFGSGEMALRWSMGGSLYAVATALGMFVLAGISKSVWQAKGPIWDVLGRDYGRTVARGTAVLSVVWLLGVLAAQILGGVAILRILGVPQPWALTAMTVAVYIASQLSFARLSKLFAASLLGSLAILIYAIAMVHGATTYAQAIPNFAHALRSMSAIDTAVTLCAVVFVVVTGADYQQFLLAAKDAKSAVAGCFAAAVFLFFAGFLPATAVVTWSEHRQLYDLGNTAGVIPFIVAHTARSLWHLGSPLILVLMLMAALGSGGAITRATGAALASITPTTRNWSNALSMVALVLAVLVALKGGGIVHSIVGLNIVFIASIAVLLGLRRWGVITGARNAVLVMCSGFVPSAAIYLFGLFGVITHHVNAWSLALGITVSAGTWLVLQRWSFRLV